MRKPKSKYTKVITHWYCQKCRKLLHTQLRFVRHRCTELNCGRFMIAITDEELAGLRHELLAAINK